MGWEIYGLIVLTNSDMCQNLYTNVHSQDYPLFFLTNDTGCSFKRKSQNSENSNAKMVLIQLQKNDIAHEVLKK